MAIKQKTYWLANVMLASSVGFSSSVFAAATTTSCSVSDIEKLPVEQQMKQYSLCADLMSKRIELLKKQQEIQKLMHPEKDEAVKAVTPAPAIPANLPTPVVDSGEPVVTGIEGAGDTLRAILRWPDGSTAQVEKNVVVKGYKILDVKINGVKARKVKDDTSKTEKGDIVFIPVGTSGTAPMGGAPAPVPVSSYPGS